MIIGDSPAVRRALTLAERYAETRLSVLIVGATGTGKEILAQYIHERSARRGPLVDVNCCALPRDMVESLLFGHRRGAFTGAVDSTVGHLEHADNGTLLLDEVASLPYEAQGKLLRSLETGEVQPLGSQSKRHVNVRVIGAAQDDIVSAVEAGQFRRDLFHRLAGVVIDLPPLAQRLEDVVPLARYFAALDGWLLEPRAEQVLLNYEWPGNVRELRLVIQRAGQVVRNGILSASVLAEAIVIGRSINECSRQPRDAGRVALARICEGHDWKGGEIAKALGISRTTLHRRLREYGLSLRGAKKYRFVPRCSEQSESNIPYTALACS